MGYAGECVGKGGTLPCHQSWALSPEAFLKTAKILSYLSRDKVGFTQQQGDRPNGSRSKKESMNIEIKEETGPWRLLVNFKPDLVPRQHTFLSKLTPGVKFQNFQHAAVSCYTYLDGQSKWFLVQMSAFHSQHHHQW